MIHAESLKKLRRQEQEMHGYSVSSRWYTGLSNGLHFLERAEEAGDALDRFRDTWSAAYNLFLLYEKPGDDEFKSFNRWVSSLLDVPGVLRLFGDASPVPFAEFQVALQAAKTHLLKKQGLQELQSWTAKARPPEKACRYFLTIIRDIRNTVSHPSFNPKARSVKKAIALASDCLLPLTVAAMRTMIERPAEGTTGKATAYRFFLWPYLKNSDSFFSDYYLERIFPEEELPAVPEDEAKARLKTLDKQKQAKSLDLMRADAAETAERWCLSILFDTLGIEARPAVKIVSEDGVFEPSYVLARPGVNGSLKAEYHGKTAGRDLAGLIWLLPWRSSLDAVSSDPAFPNLPVMEIAHRTLSRSDVPWALLTNGRQLRLLGKGTAHKPRCFLEANLEDMLEHRLKDESLLAFRYLSALFCGTAFTQPDDHDRTRLDRALLESERHGKEIGVELKENVYQALELLGDGFRLALPSAPLDTIYHESLSLMYRLLFLFYAESRNLLPMENEMYRETYSLEALRDEIIAVLDDPDPRNFFGKVDSHLWQRLQELFSFVNKGWAQVIPAYDGGLFDLEQHQFLEHTAVPDYFLARAIDLLSRSRPRSRSERGAGRKKFTYRDLDIRHLGSIYEGILEYTPQVAAEELAVLKRGSGAKAFEEYVPVSQLKPKERQQFNVWKAAIADDPENPALPRGCKVSGRKEPGQYFLVFGGSDSKRKSSGSYYTPDYIVQYIVENTLDPLIRGECRATSTADIPVRPLSADEILQLKVLDPAMGSGHFLVAATEFLARAYGEALIREGRDDDGVMSDEEFTRYKRLVAERCIYGVDINPMAVELAKLSMWLFTMDKGRPLSFLNHHLKCGNSLIGAWIADLGRLPEFDKKGKPKKRQPKQSDQQNLFEYKFKAKLPPMLKDLFGIMQQETLSTKDIEVKKASDLAVAQMKQPFTHIADAWVGTFFGEKARDYDALLSNPDLARDRVSRAADEHNFFHWELEFPEVWFDEKGRFSAQGGFSAIIGNPPYVFGRDWGKYEIASTLKSVFATLYTTIRYQLDYFAVFMEKSIMIIQPHGRCSFIIPNVWLNNQYYDLLRAKLLRSSEFLHITKLSYNVFSGAVVDTVIFVNQAIEPTNKKPLKMTQSVINEDSQVDNEFPEIDPNPLLGGKEVIRVGISSKTSDALKIIEQQLKTFDDYFEITRGVHSYRTDGYGLSAFQDGPQTKRDYQERSYHSKIYQSGYTEFITGKDLVSFGNPKGKEFIKWGDWLAEPREWKFFEGKRIATRKVLGKRLLACYMERQIVANQQVYICLPKFSDIELRCFMGVLASSVLAFFVRYGLNEGADAFPQIKISQLRNLPIPEIDDVVKREIVRSVELIEAKVGKSKNRFDIKQLSPLFRSLDEAVYKAYNLPSQISQFISKDQESIELGDG